MGLLRSPAGVNPSPQEISLATVLRVAPEWVAKLSSSSLYTAPSS
ncbi:protein of unknown function [Pseudomonas mediterranea]